MLHILITLVLLLSSTNSRSRRRRAGQEAISVQGQRIMTYAKRKGVVKWIEEHCSERSSARRAVRLAVRDQQDEAREAERLARALRISGDPLALLHTANSELLSVELRLGLVNSWLELYPGLFTGRAEDLIRIGESIVDLGTQLIQRLEGQQAPGRTNGSTASPPHAQLALPPGHCGPSATTEA